VKIEKVRRAARMAREALGKLGEELSRRTKVYDASLQIGPLRLDVEPKKPKCPECGEEKHR
jgi:hypothetical protein